VKRHHLTGREKEHGWRGIGKPHIKRNLHKTKKKKEIRPRGRWNEALKKAFGDGEKKRQ